MELENTLAKKKDELMRHISKTSSESKQNKAIGGDKGLEKEELKDRTTSYEIRLLNMDEVTKNLVLSDKDEYVQRREEGGSHYIKCDDLIICGYHPDKSKWAYVRYIYNMISKDLKVPFYEDISFRYIPSERIPSTRIFSPERSILIIFEDLCLASEHIQNRISQFFGNGRHQNISSIYVTQKYHKVSTFIRKNISHLVMYNGSDSQQDVFKIASCYTDDVKNASMVINSYL
ncbi:hypothetical protein C1646_751514 [Rhizophagus diaphanus]|nr:hypothetical protein C1646_751514 [Rhizophagus diaphanus] [Rhizophagus sp. MUCL 43196]